MVDFSFEFKASKNLIELLIFINLCKIDCKLKYFLWFSIRI